MALRYSSTPPGTLPDFVGGPPQGVSWAASSGSALQFANGDQVAVSNRSNVREAQTDERLSLTRCEDKLDFKTIGRVKIHDSAEVTTTQAMLGKVPIQNDGVEQVEHGYPGWAG